MFLAGMYSLRLLTLQYILNDALILNTEGAKKYKHILRDVIYVLCVWIPLAHFVFDV